MTETPLELRGIEARLRTLQPERNAGLVQTVALFSAISSDRSSLSIPPSTFLHVTRLVRRAQFHAALCGLFVGLFLGITLGVFSLYFTMHGQGLYNKTPLLIGRAVPTAQIQASQDDFSRSASRIIRYYTDVVEMCKNG